MLPLCACYLRLRRIETLTRSDGREVRLVVLVGEEWMLRSQKVKVSVQRLLGRSFLILTWCLGSRASRLVGLQVRYLLQCKKTYPSLSLLIQYFSAPTRPSQILFLRQRYAPIFSTSLSLPVALHSQSYHNLI